MRFTKPNHLETMAAGIGAALYVAGKLNLTSGWWILGAFVVGAASYLIRNVGKSPVPTIKL